MSLERAELVVPLRFELIEPGSQRDDRFRPEAEHPHAGVLGRAFVGHHAGARAAKRKGSAKKTASKSTGRKEPAKKAR